MVPERFKTELIDLRAKVLEIREFDVVSPEHFKCVCESLTNLQSLMVELIHDLDAQNQPASGQHSNPVVQSSDSPPVLVKTDTTG
jgi:hypothetical protein